MARQAEHVRQRPAVSQVITAHILTIQRKTKYIDAQELSTILDDVIRELKATKEYSSIYLISLNKIVHSLNLTSPSSLPSINTHYFFILVRNTIQVLLQELHTKYQLSDLATYVLRNLVILLEHLIKHVPDVSKTLHWITNITFLTALANSLNQIEQILTIKNSRRYTKQILRLLNMFTSIQERLPLDLHHSLFLPLLQPVMNCVTSSTYTQIFKDLKANATKLTEIQRLFLKKCPQFLATYNGPHMERNIEQVLKVMLPRCVTILNTHIKTIKTWRRSIKQAMYHLLIVLVFAESYFTSYLSNESLQTFIKHLLRLVNESELIKHIKRIPINPETLLIDAALQVFSVLVYEPDALDYMKQCRPSIVFQRLAASPCKAIVSNAYLMLVYTVDENDIKESQGNLSRLLYTTLNLIHKAIYPNNGIKQDVAPSLQNISRNIIQLTETLASLVQYEQVKKEIIKQNALLFLIQSSQKLSGLSKQFILKSLWTLSFDKHIARQINHNSQFIHSLQNIKKSSSEDNQQNNPTISWNESTNDEIQKIIDGLLWNLSKESEYRANKSKTNAQTKKNDVMISYSVKDKDIVNKIEGILVNEGFTVWLDQDIIHRQNMEKVAEQIDKSTMMIVCLSDSYARDNRCFSELMYGYHSKRLIVPLIIQKQYKVDEWLRSMVDKNKCIDIDISDVKKSGPLLIKEINQRKTKYSSNVRATTPAKNVLDKQKQNTPERPTSTIRFSDRTSVIPNKEPERPSSTMRISGRTSVIPNKEPERPSSTILSSGRTSVIPYKEPERPSSTIRFSDRTSVIPNKEPERPSSTIRFSDRTTVIPYKESERPSSTPRFSGRTSAIPNKESERLSSTPKLPGRTSVLLNKQSEQQQRQQEEQKYFSESESISTQTDLTLTMASSIVGNKDYQKYLPEKYTKRNTNDSPYRSLAILTWKNDDVLDFLYDFKLHLMMPLCESMSGRALLGLYGMCQRKPHRVYRQLNSELRAHYPNLTLPMAIFNQFLSEIDTLITSPPNSTRVLPSALSNDSYYPGFMPITDQSSVLSMKSNYTQSERSMMSTGTLSSGTPMNGVPHTSRVIDRAVFRPASSANRPYDLVVESNDRASVIFQQVKRYSPQLHLLQQQAREYREMNGMH